MKHSVKNEVFVEAMTLAAVPEGISRVVHCGNALVIFKDHDGFVKIYEDRCCHRHMPLSAGTLNGDRLRCRLHGWCYDLNTGKCDEIPSLAPGQKIPAKARLKEISFKVSDGVILIATDKYSASRLETAPTGHLEPGDFSIQSPAGE